MMVHGLVLHEGLLGIGDSRYMILCDLFTTAYNITTIELVDDQFILQIRCL